MKKKRVFKTMWLLIKWYSFLPLLALLFISYPALVEWEAAFGYSFGEATVTTIFLAVFFWWMYGMLESAKAFIDYNFGKIKEVKG